MLTPRPTEVTKEDASDRIAGKAMRTGRTGPGTGPGCRTGRTGSCWTHPGSSRCSACSCWPSPPLCSGSRRTGPFPFISTEQPARWPWPQLRGTWPRLGRLHEKWPGQLRPDSRPPKTRKDNDLPLEYRLILIVSGRAIPSCHAEARRTPPTGPRPRTPGSKAPRAPGHGPAPRLPSPGRRCTGTTPPGTGQGSVRDRTGRILACSRTKTRA